MQSYAVINRNDDIKGRCSSVEPSGEAHQYHMLLIHQRLHGRNELVSVPNKGDVSPQSGELNLT